MSGLAPDLFFYAPQDVLAGQYMFEDWDPALVRLLSYLLQFVLLLQHCNVLFLSLLASAGQHRFEDWDPALMRL